MVDAGGNYSPLYYQKGTFLFNEKGISKTPAGFSDLEMGGGADRRVV